jgi:hypothetical protein
MCRRKAATSDGAWRDRGRGFRDDVAGLDAEELLEHLERRGGGGGRAVTAVLDESADGDLRVRHGAVAAPP